jgi:outer membrane protein OmpA-like peptidoglycan-associated protein
MFTLYHNISKTLIAGLIFACCNVQKASAQDYEVEPISVNSEDDDFGAIRLGQGIVFCSDRNHQRYLLDENDTVHYYTDMFISRLLPNHTWTAPEIFDANIESFMNDGPMAVTRDGQTIYYTSNFEPNNPDAVLGVSHYRLGLFIAKKDGDRWIKKEPFVYNSKLSDYSMAQPSLSPNDSVLYFTSNMQGGLGGTDIYKCIWRHGQWSLPINLGDGVNSAYDELFPFITNDGILFFTSNRPIDEHQGDLNIFRSDILETGYTSAKILPAPLNSAFDDFAYTEYAGRTYGLISSNRNGGSDDIFQFRYKAPNFNDCKENYRPIFCYEIEDVRIQQNDTLPLTFEWTLGDGNKKYGSKISHCFADVGHYPISLNLVDTITGQTFFEVSSSTLDILPADQPYILSNDTTVINIENKFFSNDEFVKAFEVKKKMWIVDDSLSFEGDSLNYTFKEAGWHTVVCGVTGDVRQDGTIPKSCAYKQILVLQDSIPGIPRPHPNPNAEPIGKIKLKSVHEIAEFASTPDLVPLYHVHLTHSYKRLTFNDPFFSKTRFVIFESQENDGSYSYSVGNSAEMGRLYPIFKELQDSGYTHVKVEQTVREEFTKKFVRTGHYIEPGNADKLNIEFAKLKDIKFDYNSAEIHEESMANLDYIVAMLSIENDFDLKINAHTCSLGAENYNMELSRKRALSVMKYFAERGISEKRMSYEGFGETMPIADNSTEEGKAQNRRVEFIIIFNQNRTAEE